MIPLAYAADPVDISEAPQALADALNIPLFAGQLMIGLLFTCFFLFPTLLLTRRSGQTNAMVIVGLGCIGVCVAIGWWPVWLFAVTCLIIALLMAGKVKGIAG